MASKVAICTDYCFYNCRSNISYHDNYFSEEFTTSPPETIANFTRRVDAIAFDWVHKVLYMVNTGKHSIELVTLRGRHRKTIISTNFRGSRGIAVDPRDDQRWIYWTDSKFKPKIERAGLDGSNRTLVVATNIESPMHLAIDYADNRLFWVDNLRDTVSSCDLDGKNVQIVYYPIYATRSPYGITIFEEKVYWTDWSADGLYEGDKKYRTPGPRRLMTFRFAASGIRMYHKTRQPEGKHFSTL